MTVALEGEAAELKPVAEEKKEVRPKSVSVVGVLPEEEEHKTEVLATPAVRALARELGIRLETLKGSGPSGSITPEDVKRGAGKLVAAEDRLGPIERIPLKGLRRTIARNLMLSQRTTVSVTCMDEADITELWDLREREKKALQAKDIHLTFLPFFIKAVQHSLAEHPLLNASVDEAKEEIIVKKYYNIGVAVDTRKGSWFR